MTKDGFDCYMLYLALQRHFSTDYCFFTYKGKVRASKESYSKRNDLMAFEKLAKILPAQDRVDFFVSHFKDQPKEWIKNMSKTKLEKYKAIFKNLPIKFREDLEYIHMVGPATMIKYNNDIPKIHQEVINGNIAKESVILLNTFFPFMTKHTKEVDISFIWPDYLQSITKYTPFVEKKVNENYNTYQDIAREILL